MSAQSSPYNSAPGSPTPFLMSVTTAEHETDYSGGHREVSENLILGIRDDMQYHETGLDYMQHSPKRKEDDRNSESYIPKSSERCSTCSECKASSSCAALNDGYKCVNCGERKCCLRRSACDSWLPHMKSNWRSSLTALNQQMKQRYDSNHLEYLPQWKAHFIKLDSTPVTTQAPPSYAQLGAATAEMVAQQKEFVLDTPKGVVTEEPKESVGSAPPGADDSGELRPQDFLKMLANMENSHTAHLKAIQSNFEKQQKQFADAMQQQQIENKFIHEQLKKVQEQGRVANSGGISGKTLGGELVGGAGSSENKSPFNPYFSAEGESEAKVASNNMHPPPAGGTGGAGTNTGTGTGTGDGTSAGTGGTSSTDSTGNAVDRLAAVLEKQLIAPKQSTRLPSLTLPKLIKSNNNKIVGTNFFSFKKRCLQLFKEHNVGASIAVHLLQTEESLPKRFRQSLNNCSTVEACFQTMESMTEPLTAVYPQLINELCSVNSAFDNAEQIKLCDEVCRILLQMFEHYPDEDIQIAHITAVLSAFSSQHEINTLPSVVASFQHKHTTTHQKYSALLYDHCIQRRTDLYSIIAALQLWRKDDPINHNLMHTPQVSRGRGGRGGGSNRGGYGGRGGGAGGSGGPAGGNGSDANVDGATAKIYYRGGTKQRPGTCAVCSSKTARHKYYNCNRIAECRQKKAQWNAELCTLCIRPLAVCKKSVGRCYMIKIKDGSEISLLCKKHTSPLRYFGLCAQCGPNIESPFPAPVPHLHIQTMSDDDNVSEDDDDVENGESESGELKVVSEIEGDDIPNGNVTEASTTVAQESETFHFNTTSKQDTPPCLFLLQLCNATINGREIEMIVCYDSAAGCSSIRFSKDLQHTFIPARTKKVTIVTVSGKIHKDYPVFEVTINGQSGSFTFNCLNMQGDLPLPVIKDDCYKAIKKSGFNFLPSQQQINGTSYCLLGANYLRYFPRALNECLVPKNLRRTFPSISIFASALNDDRLVAGCLARKEDRVQYMNIQVQSEDDDRDEHVDTTTATEGGWQVKTDTLTTGYQNMWKKFNNDGYDTSDIFYSDEDDTEYYFSDDDNGQEEKTSVYYTIVAEVDDDDEKKMTPQKEHKLNPPQTDTGYDADNEEEEEDDDDVNNRQQTHQHGGRAEVRDDINHHDDKNDDDTSCREEVRDDIKHHEENDDDDEDEILHNAIVNWEDLEEGPDQEFKFFREEKNEHTKQLYREFLIEYKKAFLDQKWVDIGCHKCSKAVADFTSASHFRTHQLKNLVSFKLNDDGQTGRFYYNRAHLPNIKCLPNGIKQCGARLYRFALSLNKLPNTRQYLNYGLAADYINDRYKWYLDIDPTEREGKQIHLCPLAVVKSFTSESTTLRICQAGNALYKSICNEYCPCKKKTGKAGRTDNPENTKTQAQGKDITNGIETEAQCNAHISLNQTIQEYQQHLPAVFDLALGHRTAMVTAGADVEKYFKQIKQSTDTALLNCLFLYRDCVSNLPTFSMETEGRQNEKQILVATSCQFGLQDLSQCAQACGQKVVSTFRKHLEGPPINRLKACEALKRAGIESEWLAADGEEARFIAQLSDDCMKSNLYVDDYCHTVELRTVISFLKIIGKPMCEWKDDVLMETALLVQLYSACYTVLSLHHCSFHFKSYDGNTVNSKYINQLVSTLKTPPLEPSFPKPSTESIKAEHYTVQKKEEQIVTAAKECKEDIFLTQLGIHYFKDGTCSLKSKSLKLKGGKGKRSIKICHSMTDFENWLEEKQNKVSRKDLSAILGQFFSQNTGMFLTFPTVIIKHVTAAMARAKGPWEWVDCVDEKLIYLIRAAVRLYFISVWERQQRCSLTFQLDVVHVLIGSSDAGAFMHTTSHFLVQISKIGDIKNQKVQNLSNAVFLNKANVLAIPFWETVGVCKSVTTTVRLFEHLNKTGLYCSVKNVMQLCDSATTVSMTRSPPCSLQPKYGHVISRICMLLMSIGATPEDNIFFFLQSNKKRSEGRKFVADTISKVDTSLSEDELVSHFPKEWRESIGWFSEPPESWDFITQNPPNYEGFQKGVFQLTELTVRDMMDSRLPDPNQNSIRVLNTAVQHDDHGKISSKANKESKRWASVIKLKGESLEKGCFDTLMLRKFSRVDTKHSAFSIVALVKYYLLKLRKLAKMQKQQKQVIRSKLVKELANTNSNFPFLPSCHTRCGLVPNLTCGKQHSACTTIFFKSHYDNEHMWPNFERGNTVAVRDIFSTLSARLEALGYAWTEKHSDLLLEYVFCILATKQPPPTEIRNVQLMKIQIGFQAEMWVGLGRMQGAVIECQQQSLGRPAFRCLTNSIFSMSILRWHHLKANHNRNRAKNALLRNGFIIAEMENVFWEAEVECSECRARKAMNSAKTTTLYTTISGHALQIGQLCYSSHRQTVAVDGFGPYECLSGKCWGLIFFCLNNGMSYHYALDSLSVESFNQVVCQLTSHIGSLGLICADQGSAFMSAANIFQVQGEIEKDAPKSRKPRNPIARLLEGNQIQGSNSGIAFKCVAASSHEMVGVVEAVVKCTKASLRAVRFEERCKNYTFSKCQAIFSVCAQTFNCRPAFKMANGEIFSPYDLMSLTLLGGKPPEESLTIYTKERKIRHKLSQFAKIKAEIQEQIFNHYTKHLFISSGFRQRANFQFRSQYLDEGDIIFFKDSFLSSKSFSKSLRRISHFDKHKRHAICYHLISPKEKFDANVFEHDFANCKTKEEKQKLVQKSLGRFSFQSVDLRKCSFLCKMDADADLSKCFKRTKDQHSDHPIDNPMAFNLNETFLRMKDSDQGPSNKIIRLSKEAVQIAMEQKQLNERTPQKDLQLNPPNNENDESQPQTRAGRRIKKPDRLGF